MRAVYHDPLSLLTHHCVLPCVPLGCCEAYAEIRRESYASWDLPCLSNVAILPCNAGQGRDTPASASQSLIGTHLRQGGGL